MPMSSSRWSGLGLGLGLALALALALGLGLERVGEASEQVGAE